MLVEQIVQRIERIIDAVTDRIYGNLIIWTPLVVAAVFVTAAASAFANERLGPELGPLALAGAFFVIFLLALLFRSSRAAEEPAPQQSTETNPFASFLEPSNLLSIEKEVFNSVKSAAPRLAKELLRQAPKNLHLLAGATIGLIVASKIAKRIDRRT